MHITSQVHPQNQQHSIDRSGSPTLDSSMQIFCHHQTQVEVAKLLSLLQTLATDRPDLLGHGNRTATYALQLGQAYGLSAADLIHLHYAALLHDIGQLTLPADLLDRDGPLNANEYELVQSHPRAGAQLLESVSFLRIPALWIAHHHEYWDGSGYPYGLRGAFIPLGSRILAVADTFDTLMSRTTHRPLIDPESACNLLMLLSGSQLDPELVEIFIRHVPEAVTERPSHQVCNDQRG